ncbi:MAG: NlpC/P60 family protein [Patescibacteria group bacterium]|nr:MAG: NlpC/P60 family protein [Patescibacteria group bacterium]
MKYRAVNNRCAVIIDHLKLPIDREMALSILKNKGFVLIEVDIIELARQCIDRSKYQRGARLCEAPNIVDCSSFIKWLYSQIGIWLPRRSIQQKELGEEISLKDLIAGDVIFTSGYINYYQDNPKKGIGHVGIATGNNTVIHAANKRVGITEVSVSEFINKNKFRGIKRYIPKDSQITILKTPPDREIETSDDIRWVILQTLNK